MFRRPSKIRRGKVLLGSADSGHRGFRRVIANRAHHARISIDSQMSDNDWMCAASVPAHNLAQIVFEFLLVRAIFRAGGIFKILHRGYYRLPNPLERHLAPSIGCSVELLLATAS